MIREQHSCRVCTHLVLEYESWELPDIRWWECSKFPGRENLKSFPFMVTTCKGFEPKPGKDVKSG